MQVLGTAAESLDREMFVASHFMVLVRVNWYMTGWESADDDRLLGAAAADVDAFTAF